MPVFDKNCEPVRSPSYFPFRFEGRIWDLIVSVPDHCLSFDLTYFVVITTEMLKC